MTKIMSERACVLAIIRKLIPCGMPQHMRMNLERKVRSYAGTLDHSQEPSCCYWSASFGHEYISRPEPSNGRQPPSHLGRRAA
jgi:hypothetical protein